MRILDFCCLMFIICLVKNHIKIFIILSTPVPKSDQPVNEVRVPQALPEYFIKYSQFENARSDYLNRLSNKLSFEPSKPKGMSFYEIKEAF